MSSAAQLTDQVRERLAQAMDGLGVTQTDLGVRAKLAQPQISRLLAGSRGFGLNEVVTLARSLGLSPEALIDSDPASFQAELAGLLDVKLATESEARELGQAWCGLLGLSDPDLARSAGWAIENCSHFAVFAPSTSQAARNTAACLSEVRNGRAGERQPAGVLGAPYLTSVTEGEDADWRSEMNGASVVWDATALGMENWISRTRGRKPYPGYRSITMMCEPQQRHGVLRRLALRISQDVSGSDDWVVMLTLDETGRAVRLDTINARSEVMPVATYGTIFNYLSEPSYGEVVSDGMRLARIEGLINDQHANAGRLADSEQQIAYVTASRASTASTLTEESHWDWNAS
jgi:transcriptional regulator with XRE-family HTH domain